MNFYNSNTVNRKEVLFLFSGKYLHPALSKKEPVVEEHIDSKVGEHLTLTAEVTSHT